MIARLLLALWLLGAGILSCGPAEATSARYWRLYFPFGNQAGSEIGLTEVQMRTTSGGANQATNGANATASSQFDVGYAPTYAFDNNTGTEWVTQTAAVVGAWIKYDFGSGNDQDIVEVTLRSRNSNADRAPNWVVIQRSSDNSTWITEWSSATSGWANSTVYTFTKPTTGNGSGNPAWWRVRFPAGPESDLVYTAIAGLELRATPSGANTITTGGGDGGYPYALTNEASATAGGNQFVDTGAGNRWQATGSPFLDQWVAYKYVDIDTYDIQEIVVTASNQAGEPDQTPNYGIVESSTDGTTWAAKWYFHQSGTWSSGGSSTFSKQSGLNLSAVGGHRCWRLKVDTIAGGGTLPTVASMDIRNGSGGTNHAPLGTATATSTNSTNYPPLALDNSAGTAWQGTSGAGLPQYLTVDFGAGNAVKADRMLVTAHGTLGTTTAPASGAVEFSDDCSSWTSVATFSALTWTNGETKTIATWINPGIGPRARIITGANDNWPLVIDAGDRCLIAA